MAGLGSATGKGVGLGSTGYRSFQLPTMSPEQQSLFSQVMGGSQQGIGSGLSHLSNLAAGDQSSFQEMEAPAMRQFGAMQGGVASRFSGMGSGARQSSGFQNTMSEAGSSLAEQLSSNRMNFQRDAIQQLLGLSGELMGKNTFENLVAPEKIPFWKQLLAGLAGQAGQLGSTMGTRKAMLSAGLG